MKLDQLSLLDLLLAASVFVLLIAVWGIVMLLWARRRRTESMRIQHRLGLADPQQPDQRVLRLWHEGREVTTVVPGMVKRTPLGQQVEAVCRDAGLRMSAQAFFLLVLLGCGLLILIGLALTGSPLSGLALILATAIFGWIYVKQRLTRRQALMERQLVEALQITVRSLKAGHPLIAAFKLIADDVDAPIGPLFGAICQEQALGMPLEKAIRRSAEAANNSDMRLFATSVAIQMRSGGNLADMMNRLANVIRERIRLSRRLRVLLAQTQLSKRILIALPFVLLLVLMAINPAYVEPLHSMTVGQIMLGAAGISLLIGIWTINRLANVEY
jgi:tight adherence protein B